MPCMWKSGVKSLSCFFSDCDRARVTTEHGKEVTNPRVVLGLRSERVCVENRPDFDRKSVSRVETDAPGWSLSSEKKTMFCARTESGSRNFEE